MMRVWEILHGLIRWGLLLTLLGFSTPAFAQFGIGVGGWGGNYGFGVGVWPSWYWGPPHHRYERYETRSRTPANGTLEGTVTLPSCPLDRVVCSPAPGEPVTIWAQPLGGTQSIVSQADLEGRYRLILPPGEYWVTVQAPHLGGTAQTHRNIRIQSGQAQRQDFQITPPL